MDRAAFLDRVRAALDRAEPAELPTSWPSTNAGGHAPADPEDFLAALASVGGIGGLVAPGELADAVAEALREIRRDRSVVVAPDAEALYGRELGEALDAAHAERLGPPEEGWRPASERAAVGVTSATLALAATGSVLLFPGAEQPRVVSLLPPTHLCLVPIERLLPGLDDALPVIAEHATRGSNAVLVTGPSRTSDIEMTTVLGAHGPKAMRVVLVG